jgi:uncharacterized protein (TIGR02145 family)
MWLNSPGPNAVDIDGNSYNSKRIGSQIWLVQNLKTTHYNDGTAIVHAEDPGEWQTLSEPAYCWYDNDDGHKNTYGALYNWYTVSVDNLCPSGWRVPSQEDFQRLDDFLASTGNATGDMLKEQGDGHWISPNEGATNASGLTSLPAGYRGADDGLFYGLRYTVFFWSTTPDINQDAIARTLLYDNSDFAESVYPRVLGASVRCMKDGE